MRLHIFYCGRRPGILDIDKKIPMLTKIYPDCEIEKTKKIGTRCIYIENIAKGLKLIKFNGKTVSEQIKIDCYGVSPLAFTYFDMSFEIDVLPNLKTIKVVDEFRDMEVTINGKSKQIESIVLECMLPYYDLDNELRIEQSLDKEISTLKSDLQKMFESTAINPFSITSFFSGLSLDSDNTIMLVEDFDNEIKIDNKNWEDISTDESVWKGKEWPFIICKNKDIYKKLFNNRLEYSYSLESSDSIKEYCFIWLRHIRNHALSIRENIIDGNMNTYYWKELKQKIEVMDLNFLEFHTHANSIINSSFSFNSFFNNEYKEKTKKVYENKVRDTFQKLDEVKYAISNLSTPSHTHDEDILQQETEKVNDRILLLSFIAMAVSAIGMMQSPTISNYYKIISGFSIFCLPIVYYSSQILIKKIAFSRNKKREFTRRLDNAKKSLESQKKQLEELESDKDLKGDFRKEVINFYEKFVEAEEKIIERLKAKI